MYTFLKGTYTFLKIVILLGAVAFIGRCSMHMAEPEIEAAKSPSSVLRMTEKDQPLVAPNPYIEKK